jgi:hypothetical protein
LLPSRASWPVIPDTITRQIFRRYVRARWPRLSVVVNHAASATSIAEGIAGAGLLSAFAVAKQAAFASARTKAQPLVDSAKEQLKALT